MILLIISLFLNAQAGVVENVIEANVKPVVQGHTYNNDLDNSKFRVKVYQAKSKEIKRALKENPSQLCSFLKNKTDLKFDSSSSYVVSALKKAGAIRADDKDYNLISAHFFWEYYLTYRNFVDVSHSFKGFKADALFNSLPEGYIVQVRTGCVENGAVAIKCKSGFYTTRFANLKKLKKNLDDPNNKKCKIADGLRLIVESNRLYDHFNTPYRQLSSE